MVAIARVAVGCLRRSCSSFFVSGGMKAFDLATQAPTTTALVTTATVAEFAVDCCFDYDLFEHFNQSVRLVVESATAAVDSEYWAKVTAVVDEVYHCSRQLT